MVFLHFLSMPVWVCTLINKKLIAKFKVCVCVLFFLLKCVFTMPTESDSDYSLSGFETVASHSFDSEEDEGSVTLSVPYHSPGSMFQECHHGDGDAEQPNGSTEHRSVVQHPSAFRNVAAII